MAVSSGQRAGRPGEGPAGAALLALALGAVLASRQVGSLRRRRTMRQRLRHGRRWLGGALGLPSLAVTLLANPMVRGYLRRMVLRAVSRRLGR